MSTNTSTKIIAVGNPGAGKSSVLNSLSGENLFKSGLSIGKGLTYQLDERVNGNGHFLDTPGLADMELRKQAGKAISDGLKMGGEYKVLFFVTEHGGRVAQQDATTMKLVLDAAPEIGEKYGIIVNMVSKGVLKKLQTESMYHDFNNSMLAGIDDKNKCIYSNIIFFGKIEELEDEDNIVVPPDTFKDSNGVTLTEFVNQIVPSVSIQKDTVSDIRIEDFDEISQKIETMAKEILEKDEAWKEEKKKLEKQRIDESAKFNQKIKELEEEKSRKVKDRVVKEIKRWRRKKS